MASCEGKTSEDKNFDETFAMEPQGIVLQSKENYVSKISSGESSNNLEELDVPRPSGFKELIGPLKFNCVMCDNHFIDLMQLESHVKSHNEVLHFSILLKKVGKENEERTKTAITSLLELATSSDVNISKFLSVLTQKTKVRGKKVKQRRKGKPRKKQSSTDISASEVENCDVWTESAPALDTEAEKPSCATQRDLGEHISGENYPTKDEQEETAEPEILKNVKVEPHNDEENDAEEDAEDEWNAIAEREFQLVKKEGPGRPAYGLNCPVCDAFITGRTRLKIHMRKEHGKFKCTVLKATIPRTTKNHTCEVCGVKLNTLKRLKTHLAEDHNVTSSSNAKTYKCPLCESFFGRRGELKEHRASIHPGLSEHVCTVCGKMLMSASLLDKHMRNHTGEKPFKCDVCPRAFSINTKLQEHQRQHTGEKPFVCDVCGAKFNRSCNKKRHMLIHEGKYPHTCEHCGKGFRDIGPLTLHIRRHTGEKPYKCEDVGCSMAFITRGELETHRAKHTQKREHLCSLCGAEFLYKGDLRRHAKLHTGERPYECSDCNAAFTRNQHLKHHWQSHHASGARIHKEWKPRKKPDQFGLPMQQQSCVKSECHPSSSVLSVHNTSVVQQSGSFIQHSETTAQPSQQQQSSSQQQSHMCVICNQWFSSEGALKAHSMMHTLDNEQMFLGLPSSCRQDYNQLTGIHLNNLSTAVPSGMDICTICNVLLAEPGSLQAHLQNVHGQYS